MLLHDLFFVSLAWWLGYLLRFHTALFPSPEPYVFRAYFFAWFLVVLIWGSVFELLDLYHPRRISTHFREIADIVKASFLALVVFLAVVFLLHDIILSRIVVVLFWILSVALLNLSHVAFREGLRFLRQKGYNLRHILVIGSPTEAKDLVCKLLWYRHLGLRIVGVYLIKEPGAGGEPEGVRILERREDLLNILGSGEIDEVFVTLSLEDVPRLREIKSWLRDEPVSIHFIPVLGELTVLRSKVEEFDGLHIVSLQDSPLHGWNSFLKRVSDLCVGGLALLLFSPLMALIAVGIKLTSSGPILLKQERMGLDGRRFQMLKFRTMVIDAEEFAGPTWTSPNDPRVTRLGRWLRRMSLDELPQLINVLRGEMSLVGPRPERPSLIEEFRKAIPKYMLRHKVKAGMTGWAQVNGWRGDTSLLKRIEHDIYYIENWSLWLDGRILALTLLRGFLNKNAY